MQNYTKIQKFISFFLIFSLLLSFTIHISFFSFLGTIFAADTKNYNIVSIFVQEEIYSGVRNSINTYARNIQGVLENTKTMIIPISGKTHPFNIASLNEKLYFEGYEGLDGLKGVSRLVGTVFIGDFPLPVVENAGSYEKTVFPYVDFEEKLYIYSENEKLYTLNKNSIKTPKAEIWHGFISPNTGNRLKDIQEINDYFTKNNDFYNGTGNFENSKGIINGNEEDELLDEYKPYVFYYDQIRESKAVKYVEYKAYEATLQNLEDISYNRFSAELAEKLKGNYFDAQNNYIGNVSDLFGSGVNFDTMLLGPTTQNIPDIQVRHIIQNTTKNFLEIFNGSSLGEMRKQVHNAGRYNSGSNMVNVDLIPTLISNLDTFSQFSIKNVNNDLEKIIDDVVKNGLSRDIAIPSTFEIGTGTYINFLYGMQAGNIATAGECSFYRGATYDGGQLVQSNRTFNIQNVQGDIDMCQKADTRGYWGGNSPLNLDTLNSMNGEIWKLKFSDPINAIVPLYDVLGSLQSTDTTKNPDPRICFENNFLLTKLKGGGREGEPEQLYSVPVNGNPAINWNCSSKNIKFPYNYTFNETYKNFPTLEVKPCDEHNLILDGKTIKYYVDNNCGEGGGSANEMTSTGTENVKNYHFHKISSWIEHKSPNSEELYKQTQYMISPNLPIDTDRYIDFIAADNTYAKIKYPYLFRLDTESNLGFHFENTKNNLKNYLDEKSREINKLIQVKNPSKLTEEEREIYEILKNGEYPQSNIDLYTELLKKPDQKLEILGEKKTLSYVDTIVFSILWNNLTSVSAKYAFVFENYLSDQFGGNDFNFYLPKNKRQYEMSYLGAPGDPQNMYIKLDPEEKGENPYLSILQANQALNSQLFSIKDIEESSENLFKCAPPEGVPIWEWIPAVMCRLKDMLPPKIRVSEGNCGLNTLNFGLYNDNNNVEYCIDCTKTGEDGVNSNLTVDLNKNEISDNGEKGAKEEKFSRGNVFSVSSYKLSTFAGELVLDSLNDRVIASQSNNIFIIDEKTFLSQKSSLASLNSYSPAKEKLFLTLSHTDKKGNHIPITYPLHINVYNQQGKKIIDTLSLPSASQAFPVKSFQESGIYTLEIKDAKNFTSKKQISILSDTAEKIDPQLSTNLMEKGGVITTHVFSLYDQFDNPTIGEIYTVEAQISGNSIVFENGQKTQTFQVYDGYKAFRLKSTPIAGNSNITFTLKLAEKTLDTTTRSISVVDKIDFVLTGVPSEIKVGNHTYPYSLEIKNQIEGTFFNSRAYLVTKGNYITSKDNYINIQNGKANGSFQTKTKAGEKVQLEFKIEGVKESIYQKIDILPDTALRVDLTLSKSQIEASTGANSILYAEIKDRYGNIVWSDNETILSLEIPPQYRDIISVSSNQVQVQKGRGTFIFRGTSIPGTAYYKISTTPNLSQNKIEIPGQTHFKKEKLDVFSGMRQDGVLTELGKKFFTDYDLEHYRFIYFDKQILESSSDFQAQNLLIQKNLLLFFDEHNKIIISGVGENIGKIETFYFWNKQKINGNKYNSIYTTLLGSSYGDITIPDNLANSLIFDKENRALGVTTLLNDTTKHDEVLNIYPSGNLKLNYSTTDISQNLSSSIQITQEGNLEVSLHNHTFDTLISKVYYNIKSPKLIDTCHSFQVSDCFDTDKTSIVLQSKNYNYTTKGDEKNGLRLLDEQNKSLLEISSNGKIIASREIQFELSKNNTNGLILDVKVGNQVVAHLALHFVKNDIKIVRNTALFPEVKDAQTNGGMLVYLEGRDYFFKESYLGSSTKEDVGYIISYNDPFGSSRKTYNQFSTFFEFGYEKFEGKAGLGWQEDNKILLSFAAGKTIGQASKDFMSFSLINIGDPVASLKPIYKKLPGTQKTRKYDATIGHLISNDDDTIGYNIFDYNNDKNEDIAVLKREGYIELLEGTDVFGDFIKRGNLIYIADISPKSPIITGDFFGDDYDDIILLSKNREIIVISNVEKDFQRISHTIQTEGNINQMIGFDMDGDGKMDLVILDDLGNLYVFYGGNTSGKFEKKLVDTGLGVVLNEEARKQGGAIYFDGLYQIPRDKTEQNVQDSETLLQELKTNRQNLKNTSKQEQNGFNEGLIDKLIFTQMNYTPSSIKNGIQDTQIGMDNLLDNYDNIGVHGTQLSNDLTTFLRSEYAEYQGLEISKQYTDINGSPLRGGDDVELKITIKNSTSQIFRDIAYVEKIHDMFSITENSDYSLKIGDKKFSAKDIVLLTSPSSEYTFILESYKTEEVNNSISLHPGEILEFNINLTTKAFEYGHIDAGFFDTTTEHGDIIFKDKDENCGKEVGLYKSIAKRDYLKDVYAPSCENNLPDEYVDNAIDADKNGIPDYIDKLLSGENSHMDYANKKLDEFNGDSDGDGIPDREDISPRYDSSNDDFMNSLSDIDVNVDEIMAGIDTILAGLSCGFGGGGCISSPLNWAPLAPGNDPTLFGIPVGDGLNIDEGLPIFSALTGMWYGPYCGPSVWPISPLTTTGCGEMGAGGWLGVNNPANFIRIFVTPTLTGAVGIAICFGGPASVMGQSNPPGFHPLVPGGNCIIAAAPVLGCKNDGSDGEIYNLGNPHASIINGNCSASETGGKTPYLGKTAKDYLQYKNTGKKSGNLDIDLKEILSTVASGPATTWQLPDTPLLNIGDENNPDLEVSLDFGALQEGNFQDVLDIQMKRISPFPDFVMEWVTRQIEEIANKLTDFPTLYIILPDFQGVFDNDFNFFIDGLKNAYSSGEQRAQEKQQQIQGQIDSQKGVLHQKNCEEDSVGCMMDDLEVSKLEAQKSVGNNQTVSGIKAAYEFLSSMPILKIEPQKVDFNIPWIDETTIDKAIADFEATKRQWTEEIQRAQKEWDLENYACIETSSNEGCKVLLNAQNLINSIDKNIEILESYKNIPEDIFKMVKIKDVRIEQILCNLETISQIMGGRIGENGKRFKAWVELYVLIKAILKSWQLLVDVFIDYDAECHECKNERYDLLYFIWKLISMVLPKIPVIQFPKWPDIYLDLHNIRVLLLILIPEFEFNLRPILLPPLPNLYLPNSPNINITLPSLPLLPEFELPTLPDLPSLPTVELPNLPPPPKLPKLLSAIEAFLNILKLITKAMCILKTSPFVPEWRAGDQIAFITERTGYLGIDFLDMSLPQFSFPFVDAIKVTTYVNLEFEVEFLVEMARQMALPINVFGNDIANMINIGLGDLDFRGVLPESIDINLDTDGTAVDVSYVPENFSQKINLIDLASIFALNILKGYSSLQEISSVELDNEEFKKEIAKQLPNIENEKIQGVWQNALNYSFSKENKLIETLLLNNEMKYQEIKSILQQEKYENIEVMASLQEKLGTPQPQNILTISHQDEKYSLYNTRLQSYNEQAKSAVKNLFVEDATVSEIRQESRGILDKVSQGFSHFSSDLEKSKKAFENIEIKSNQLLASNIPTTLTPSLPINNLSQNQPQTSSGESCALGTMSGYNYIYKGIYIVEKFLNRNISYYLFDYLDELTGKEIVKEFDFDSDEDKDIIYMIGSEIYLKKNYLTKKQPKSYYTGSPIILTSGKNPYLKGDFISAVNGFRQVISDSGFINIGFNTSDNKSNYRIEFFPIVDKFDDMILGYLSSYTPKNIKKYIIDAFAQIDTITLDMEKTSQNSFMVRKNLASIQSLTNLPGIQLYTKELKNLKDDIASNSQITLNAGTKIYTGKDAVRINYYFYKDKNKELKNREARLNAGSNIEFKEDIVIIGITGDVFVEGSSFVTFTGNQIANYLKKPLLPGTQITYRHLEVARGNPSLTIEYYDHSEVKIDFNETLYYELYDLGRASQNYSVRTQIENDFYYAKIKSFQNRLFSSYSNQVLLAPQNESDKKAPEISNMMSLKVPIYQQKIFDISDFIFENSGNKNIKDIYIDFDLNVDSEGDGNKINDRDFSFRKPHPSFTISKEGTKILLKIGPFDKLMNKPMRLYVVDGNNNVGARNIQFSVYSPIPRIENIAKNTITGLLNENLLREPVSFYRLRNNSLTRLEDVNKKKTTDTFEGGRFSFQVPSGGSGITISSSGETLFRVNEETGRLQISDILKIKYKLDVRVYPSNHRDNEFAYPKIVLSKENLPIYYQYLVAPNSGQVEVVRSFSEVLEGVYRVKPGVYYLHEASNNFEYFHLPLGIENNSGDIYIYSENDTKKQPLFIIHKDGRIHTLGDLYYLEYTTYGEYVVYNLKRIGMETTIGRVMIIPEKNYIVK